MARKHVYYVLLVLMLLAALFLRTYRLRQVPPAFFCDEISIAYNAWSLLTTGRDETGTLLPVYFRSFGDYKHPVFIYLTALTMMLGGHQDITVRIPAVLLGMGLVVLVFLLGRKILGEAEALLAALFLAFSPWALLYSRFGISAISLPFLFCLGLWVFSLRRSCSLIFTFLIWGLTLYTYAIARGFLLLIIPVFILTFDLWRGEGRKKLRISLLIFALLAMPAAVAVLGGQGTARFASLSIFGERGEQLGRSLPLIGSFSEVKPLFYLLLFLRNYLLHLSPTFLFVQGSSKLGLHAGLTGLYQLPLLVPFVMGLVAIVLNWRRTPWYRFLLFWLLLSAVPPALTAEDLPHPIRFIPALPVIALISALGLRWLWDSELLKGMEKRVARTLDLVVLLPLLAVHVFLVQAEVSYFFSDYPRTAARDFQYGLSEGVELIKKHRQDFDAFVISPGLANNQFYSYYLFYYPVEPQTYLRQGIGTQVIFPRQQRVPISEGTYALLCFPFEARGITPLHVIYYPDRIPALYLVPLRSD